MPAAQPEEAFTILRGRHVSPSAAIAITAAGAHPGAVVLLTSTGGTHLMDMLSGDQLPRIC